MSSIIQTYPPPGWFLFFYSPSNLLSKIPTTIKINKFAKTNQLTHQKKGGFEFGALRLQLFIMMEMGHVSKCCVMGAQ
jgi:hypothetical protein